MRKILLVAVLCLMGVLAAVAQENTASVKKEDDSLPRFVSLRSNPVNARSGPGVKYPIEWVYMQKSAPVEVIAEFEDWRRIRDWQGSESWIKSTMLNKNRYAKIITAGENNLYLKSNYKSQVVARVEDGAIAKIVKCPQNNEFCLLKFEQIEGWMPRKDLYGVYPEEAID